MRPFDDTAAECRPLHAREFAQIRQLAYDTFGLDLRAGKETLVSARLGKHIRRSGCRSFEEYYRRAVEDSTGETLVELVDALTTNHTSFFREPAHFDFLRQVFLPEWGERGSFRVWSAACSTGEEPYSIAMCLLEALGPVARERVRVLATDISTRVLTQAARAVYPAERFGSLPGHWQRKYWLRGAGEWAGWYRAKSAVRSLVEFRRANLLEPLSGAGGFPLIFCRNVMIYFDKPTQQRVVERLAGSLEPGGYLLTGHAEGLAGIEHGLRYVQPAVYRKAPRYEREKGRW